MKYKRDLFDEMFDHPELTMRQADWKVNGRKYIARWMVRILWIILIVGAVIWIWK